MIISASAHQLIIQLPDVFPIVDPIKVLGISIEKQLNFKFALQRSTEKGNVSFHCYPPTETGMLSKHPHEASTNATVVSVYDYCAPAFTGLQDSITGKVQATLNRGEKIISGSSRSRINYQQRKETAALKLFNKTASIDHHLHTYHPGFTSSGRVLEIGCRLSLRSSQFFSKTSKLANRMNPRPA